MTSEQLELAGKIINERLESLLHDVPEIKDAVVTINWDKSKLPKEQLRLPTAFIKSNRPATNGIQDLLTQSSEVTDALLVTISGLATNLQRTVTQYIEPEPENKTE